jgi:hypothetical protein
MKIIIGLFLIAHGLVHVGLAAAPDPNESESKPGAFFTAPQRSWLLPQLGLKPAAIRRIGILLVVFTTLGFVLAGLGVFGVPGLAELWRTIAVVSAVLSLLLLLLFWHPWIILGVLIDVGIIFSLVWADWPSPALIGY